MQGCNEALLAKAVDAKLLRTNRVRCHSTVGPADVAHLTDSGLLAKAIRRIAVTGRRVQAFYTVRETRRMLNRRATPSRSANSELPP